MQVDGQTKRKFETCINLHASLFVINVTRDLCLAVDLVDSAHQNEHVRWKEKISCEPSVFSDEGIHHTSRPKGIPYQSLLIKIHSI